MTIHMFVVLFVLVSYSCSSTAYTLTREKGEEDAQENNEDFQDIEDIANRDYETAMGRIIAVNMAHSKKRRDRTKRDNVWGAIEKNNERQHVLPGMFQGDIDTESDPELEKLIHHQNGRAKRNAVRGKKRLWKTRYIPYEVPSWMSNIIPNLNEAIQYFYDYTCLRFVPYDPYDDTHTNYIRFANDKGCSSKVGMKYYESGSQKVSLGKGCNFVGTIIHELMHAIGFFHEQSRSDRGSFVKIYWDNILDGFSSQFDQYDWLTIDDLGKDYDYQSIMHYDRQAFTKNGLPTIVNIFDESMKFGTEDKRLSQKDIIEINALYDCSTTTTGWSSWSEFTPCDKYCYKERGRYCYHSGNDPQACQGNTNAYGIEKQNVSCPLNECPEPIDGNWGRWSDWSDCSASCGDGFKTRFRKCNNPTPMHNGSPCPGAADTFDGCSVRRCVLDYDDTDFENNMGMWINEAGDSTDWQRHTHFTQTIDTGPSFDHTIGNHLGYYLYVESSGQASNSNAKLRSPWLYPVSGGQCLKFFYFMYGETMGELRVKIELEGLTSYLIFYENGDKGIGWKNATQNIDASVRYRLTLEARIGGTGYSDIAIDDVYIDPGFCDCQDTYYTGCTRWASEGECQSNEQWMNDFCKRSCNSCPQTGVASCVDVDTRQCPLWAIQGYCETNVDWMMDNCKKSCGVCGCNDDDKSCPTWAALASCVTNPDYMLANCQSSCKVCGCEDKSPHCSSWTQTGECGNNPAFMLNNCCHSCRCENWVKDLDCDAWASAGYCESTPEYMKVNCKKSCNIC